MSDSIDDFVRNGIARYAEAQQTVTFFRERAFELLERALKQALRDGPCTLTDKPDIRRLSGDSNAECWVTVYANVRLPHGTEGRVARLEVGIWWNPSVDSAHAPCVVYSNLRDDAAVAGFAFAPDAARPRVRVVPTPGGRWTRLCVTVAAVPDLQQDAAEVLATLQAALASSVA